MHEIRIEALYAADPDRVFAEALDFAELAEAMTGLARYEGLPEGEAREGETYTVDVTLWGWLKNTGHVMHVERLDRGGRVLQSREHNAAIRHWDHELSVQSHPQGALWTDTIHLDAGWQTALTARFSAHVYQYRHKRRQALEIKTKIRKLPG